MNRKQRRSSPDNGDDHVRQGNSLLLAGKAEKALEAYKSALKMTPNNAATWTNMGIAFGKIGRYEDSAHALRRAIELKPDFAEAHFNLGNCLLQQGRWADSIAPLLRATELKPDMAMAYSDLGNALYLVGERKKSIIAYGNAIALDPTSTETYSNMANPLTDEDRLDEALAMTLRAIQLDPNRPHAHSNLGNVLVAAGRLNEALSPYRHALALRPDYAEAHINIGHVMAQLGRAADSIAAYREAIRLRPNYADARLFLAMLLLRQGEFEEGWREYEWRWKTASFQNEAVLSKAPLWAGEDLAGKHILLTAEQGLGDTIQFIRYAALLQALGATVTAAVPKPLLRLIASAPGVSRVVADTEQPPPADYRLPMMSVPYVLGVGMAGHAECPYLSADATEGERWRRRLEEYPGIRVGLVWAGAPRVHDRAANRTDRRRSLSLTQMAPLLTVAGVSFFSLQKGSPATQLADSALPIHDFMDEITDMADTAALVSALDLVIAADTSVAHLAGALGKPVWILSRFDGCWRWREEGETSDLYPTARLFRQSAPGDWDSVITDVGRHLEKMIEGF